MGFEGQLVGFYCIKGHPLTEAITYPWLMLVTFGLTMMMLKSPKLSFNNFCNSNTVYILLYKRST